LTLPAAEELLALVNDDPGDADEDLLSDALEGLGTPRVVDNATHARRKRGEVVAIGFTPQERKALEALILDEVDLPADVQRRSQERLTQAVSDARSKFA
jgi:threonine dehydrogenase-like Zn-dependent dehydrogenase